MKDQAIYKRVVLKLSGEAMAGAPGFGFDPDTINSLALQVQNVVNLGVEVALVVGGGNIWRGGSGSKRLNIPRAEADYMGMLATVMNGIALQGALEGLGIPVRLQSSIEMLPVCETFTRRSAIHHLEKGRVVIFVAGTGNPYFSTDTVAALRAAEIGAQLVVKATQVDGVYTADPRSDSNAVRFSTISYAEYLARELQVLDTCAIALCMENKIPVIVLSLANPKNIALAMLGKDVGTVIGGE
ncbi:MAG: UMP kinase [Symbiobacteriaceae bacterium]|nr:UMP kinase [Symbiobacteriaceae bacterium]